MIQYGLLGTVVVRRGGEMTPVRWAMARNVLAALLLNPNRVVPVEFLVDVLWGNCPPSNATASLQNHVMRLRSLLAQASAGQITTVAPGYLIEVQEGGLDAEEFKRLLRSGRAARAREDWMAAGHDLSSALGLWRGEPLEDVTSVLLLDRESTQLSQLRLEAVEARIDADLRLGRYDGLTAELAGLTAVNPLRERFHAQLMLAHFLSGRQAEALSAFGNARTILAEELGLDPGPELQDVHQQVLSGRIRGFPAGSARIVPMTPAELPADLDDFTGRANEVQQVTAFTSRAGRVPGTTPLCVVTGPAGIGKTSLAIHSSHKLRGRFPDGQLFARLSTEDGRRVAPTQVLSWFLRDLGAGADQIPDQHVDRAAHFRSKLAGRRVLIVLDDARSAGQVLPLLPGTGGCAVIVTSRRRLSGLPSAHLLPLSGLPDAEAFRFLSRVIGVDRLQAEDAAATIIVGLCGGLPLALRIAACRLAARPHWRVQDLAARIATAPLDELAIGELSVRASFEVSYAQLDGGPPGITLARAFQLLWPWAGSEVSAEAAAAAFGVDTVTAETALEGLLDEHLVDAAKSAGRYRIHELLGMYAAERAREEERLRAVSRPDLGFPSADSSAGSDHPQARQHDAARSPMRPQNACSTPPPIPLRDHVRGSVVAGSHPAGS